MGIILQGLGFIFLIIIILVMVSLHYTHDILVSDELAKYLQSIFYIAAMGTFVVAVSQFRYNTKWNKKQLTIKMLHGLKDELKVHFEFLHKTFKYRDLKEPISCDTIHEKMGKFLEDESKIESECNKEEVVNISGRQFVYHSEDNKNGKDINNKIKNFLNDLETFAAAVNDGTFDEKQSKTLMKGVVRRAYKYFKPYILHLRQDHEEVSQSAYKELFTLGEKWSK
jgi:hypothetical protein